MIDAARLLYCDASEKARHEKDGFIEAAATMLQTLLMDGMSPSGSQLHFLDQALQTLDFELFSLREQFMAQRTPRKVAVVAMAPRLELRDLIEENKRQFQLREDCLLLAETRLNVDRHMASGQWFQASNVAQIGLQNTIEMFGTDHWWNAVMMVRLATALLRQQKVAKAQSLIANVGSILDEWTDYSVKGDVFAFERDALRTAQHDIALMTA
jgi:hypothetical protein